MLKVETKESERKTGVFDIFTVLREYKFELISCQGEESKL